MVIITAAVAVILSLLLWYALDVFLLAFAGVLLSIFLRSLSDPLSKYTPLAAGWSLATVVIVLVASLGVAIWFFAPKLASQIDQLAESLPRSAEALRRGMEQYEWGRQILARLPEADELMPGKSNVLAKATGIFSSTLGVIVNLLIILFLGLYMAAEPNLYKRGLIRLVPVSNRERALKVLNTIHESLRWWLIGRISVMTMNGVLTMAGLWMIGAPMPVTLGLLTALLNFVPNLGPVLAAIPAILLALTQSPKLALYVLMLYVAIQSLEGFVLTPVVQKRTVELPPALLIIAQVLAGVLSGSLGILLATPLAVVVMILVKMLYVEDVLGDSFEVSGSHVSGGS
jgi:predicted PurR-regulated permease PerM